MRNRPIRVVLGKVGLDLHDIGAKFVARSLSDAGMEVVYLGPFQTAASILDAVVSEDPDAIAISSISGEYKSYIPEILGELARQGLDPIVIVGGLVPDADRVELLAMGVAGVFGQGTAIEEVVRFLEEAIAARDARRAVK